MTRSHVVKAAVFVGCAICSPFAYSACPPIEDGALWLPASKKSAEADFQAKAKRLNDSGIIRHVH